MLGDQPLPDPPGGVPLLARRVLVGESQASITATHGSIAGRGRAGYTFRGGGTASGQRLAHRPPMHAMPIRQLPDRQVHRAAGLS